MVSRTVRLGRETTQPELRLTVLTMHDVRSAVLGEQIQMPVDRSQADLVPPPTDLIEKLLRATKPIGIPQNLLDGRTLAGVA
jgi:hypothetical protein